MGIINTKKVLVPQESKELKKFEEDGLFIENIKESDLPSIIGGQIEKYKELDKSISESLERAEKAKKKADSARNESAGFFNRRNAIEAVQESGYDNAEAIMALAGSQKISFEFQTKLAEISKFLFMLGVTNIALNRTTVRQLQLKLEGASKEKLSELVKSEIRNVIQQLKSQQDILEKQKNLEKSAKELHEKQETQLEKVEEHKDLIERNAKKINNNARKLKATSDSIQSLTSKIESYESLLNSIKRSLKKSKIEFESIKQELNEIKEIKQYFEDKFGSIKKIFFTICAIIGITFILSIISIVISLINK